MPPKNEDFFFYTQDDGDYRSDVEAEAEKRGAPEWLSFRVVKRALDYTPRGGDDWPEGTVLVLVKVGVRRGSDA